MTKEEKIATIEKQLKKKRRMYNRCRSYAKRVQLDYEIGCLYKELVKAYNEEGEK